MKSYRKELRRLLAMIPVDAFECIPGCSDCCKYFQCTWTEWDQIEDKRLSQYPLAKCPYIMKSGGCEIYEQRPVICRLFGLVTEHLENIPHGSPIRLLCTKGIRPKVEISKTLLRDIFISLMDIQNREAADALNIGAKPVPAGPFGMWIWDELKRMTLAREVSEGAERNHTRGENRYPTNGREDQRRRNQGTQRRAQG